MGFLTPDVIATDAVQIIPDGELYHFGVLMSSVHMAWIRCISGRLTSRLSYSNTLDYNAFPWPNLKPISFIPGENPRKLRIIKTAQAILDARALYPRSSLADLYDERTMPPELRKAHEANDEAVMKAYEFVRHYDDDRQHDEDIAISLMYMYKELTGCEEHTDSYPNLKLWERYYGPYEEAMNEL